MADHFDPYHKWLGISPEKQPPNLYQLLAVELYEDDPDVIESAADQRMAHVRTFQSGKQGKLSQKLLNEISAARVTLLNPDKKSAYDEELRQEVDEPEDPLGPSIDQLGGGTTLPAPGSFSSQSAAEVPGPVVSTKPAVRKRPAWILPVGISVGALLILGVVIAFILGRSKEGEDADAVADRKTGRQSKQTSAEEADGGNSQEATGTSGDSQSSEDGSVDEQPDSSRTDVQKDDTNQHDEASNPLEAIDQPEPNPDGASSHTSGTEDTPSQQDESTKPIEVETPKKESIPTDAQQQAVYATLEETFELSEERTPEQQLELARELFKLADESNEPVEKFVLLRGSMKYAGEGGDAQLVFSAVNKIDRHFEIDRLEIAQQALLGFARSAATEEAFGSLVEAASKFIKDAVAEERIDLAYQLAEGVYETMVKASAPAKYRKQAYDQRNRLKEIYQKWKTIEDALAKLETDPADPEANLAVGTWHCFELQDWKTGLPYLAKSGHQPLSTLASREKESPPETATEMVTLADAWWEAVESASDYREDMQRRAGYWYELAQDMGVQGIRQVKVEQRLEKLKPLAPFSVAKHETVPTSQGGASPQLDAPGVNLLAEAILVLTFEPDTLGRDGQKILVKDLSGRGNHGLVHGASMVEGKVGRALSFDGKDDFVQLPTIRGELVQGTEAVTIAVWVAPRNTSKHNMIFDVGSKGNGSLTLSLFEKENQKFVSFAVAKEALVVPMPLSRNWHHLVATWNGTGLRIFHNGELLGERGSEVSKLDGRAILSDNARIGSQAKSGYREKRFLDGIIDEFAILRRAISPAEIKAIYQLGVSGRTLAQ